MDFPVNKVSSFFFAHVINNTYSGLNIARKFTRLNLMNYTELWNKRYFLFTLVLAYIRDRIFNIRFSAS